MDYFGILKKAWNITWKYKALWVLGLFAGMGSGSGGNSGSSYQQSSSDVSSGTADQFTQWASDNLLLIAIVVGVLVVIAVVFWVLSIAAQGGLVHGANEGAEDRKPSLRDAWGVGFSKWGRTFMIGFMLGLPILAVVAVFSVLMLVTIGGGAAAGDEAAGAAIAGGLCLVLPIFVVVIIALSVIIGIVYQLALRYGVLDDITFGQAIKRGWNDLWAKRGAFVMWLVMLLPQFAIGMVMLLFMLPFMLPAIGFAVAGQFVMAGAFGVLMVLVLMLPGAVYGTFVSAAWTVFFRQMTGREPSTRSMPAAPPSYGVPAAPLSGVDAPPPPSTEPADAPIVDVAPVAAVDSEADAPVVAWAAEAAPEPAAAEEPPVYVEAPEPMRPPAPEAGFAAPEAPAEAPASVEEAPPAEEEPPADA